MHVLLATFIKRTQLNKDIHSDNKIFSCKKTSENGIYGWQVDILYNIDMSQIVRYFFQNMSWHFKALSRYVKLFE